MNREIEFRGKNSANEWLYGYLTKQLGSDCFIIESQDCLGGVITETIGQYTGLKDKNGTKIFEGDIFEDEKNEIRGIVIFENSSFRIKWFGLQTTLYEYGYDDGSFGEVECETFDMYNIDQMEVIGNIYDNPELLQQTE